MKHARIVLCLICIFALCITMVCSPVAHAEALTIGILGGAMIAVGASLGLYYLGNSQSATNLKNWAETRINTFLDGRSITEVFGSDVIRLTAGRLIVPATIYNKFLDIFNDDIEEAGVSPGETKILSGEFYGYPVVLQSKNPEPVGFTESWSFSSEISSTDLSVMLSGSTVRVYINGELKNTRTITTGKASSWYLQFPQWVSNVNQYVYLGIVSNTGSWSYGTIDQLGAYVSTVRLDNNIDQTVLNPSQGWAGTIDGAPDTNLDQLIGSIYEKGAVDDLSVDGEIIEPGPAPTPVPTPFPVDPETPLQDVPWEGLNDLIGNTAEGIQEQIQSQTESVTSAQEATTEAVESLTDTLTDALDVPDAEELPDFKFDLRELFPFCIPFDIYRLLSSFDAQPQAPHVQIPIVIESIGFSHNLDLDFSAWNPVAQAMRTAELIVYAIALAWATGKVIKW